MPIVHYECPNCGSNLILSSDGKLGICHVCDSQFLIEENLVKHKVSGSISIDGLTNKAQLHKRAEQLMQDERYAEASALYHEIIDKHDAHDSDAWWGLARVSAGDFVSIDHPITREQLGQYYTKANEYATPEKRAAYEATLRRHEDRHQNMVAERDARERAHRAQLEAEAAQRRLDQAAAQEQARLSSERLRTTQRQEREARARERAVRMKKTRKRGFIVLIIIAVCGVIFWFGIMPSMRYNSAAWLYDAGNYFGARAAFSSMGSYRDSRDRVLICDALISLENGEYQPVLDTIRLLDAEGTGAAASSAIKAKLLTAVQDWKERGMEPEALLTLLSSRALFDQNGVLDEAQLSRSAHIDLVSHQEVAHSAFSDVDGDGAEDLVVLAPDQGVSAYRMLDNSNAAIPLTKDKAVRCLLLFAGNPSAVGIDTSIECYRRALDLQSSPQIRASLSGVYRVRADASLANGDIGQAVKDAASAFDVDGSKTAFSYYYQTVQEKCARMDEGEAIAVWNAFQNMQATSLAQFELAESAVRYDGELHLGYAQYLSEKQDPACIDWFLNAEACGLDIATPLAEAAERFGPGWTRVRLYDMACSRLGEDAACTGKLRETLATVLPAWNAYGVDPQRVFTMLDLAKQYGADMTGIDAAGIYRQACLAIAGGQAAVSFSAFVDWDQDGREELVALSREGQLRYYSLRDAFELLQEFDLDMAAPTVQILRADSMPLILAEDGQDAAKAFSVYAYRNQRIEKAVRESNISDYDRKDGVIRFRVALPGRIARYRISEYSLSSPFDAPVPAGCDWQKESYPSPQSATDAAIRYFEALSYHIPEEILRLTAPDVPDGLPTDFSRETLAGLGAPDDPLGVEADAYWMADDDTCLVESRYASASKPMVIYLCAVHERDGWLISGAAQSFTLTKHLDVPSDAPTNELICLNQPQTGQLENGTTIKWYRVLLPKPAKVDLAWLSQSGSGSFEVDVYDSASVSDRYLAFHFRSNPVEQRTNPFFLPAGNYYIAVSGDDMAGVAYAMSVNEAYEEHIELERNDDASHATRVGLNETTCATLQTSGDIDVFSFSVAQPGALSIKLQFEKLDTNDPCYMISLYDAKSGDSLYSESVGGNTPVFASPDIYLAKGDYYVQFSRGKAWFGSVYSFELPFAPDDAVELEANNRFATATPMRRNEEIKGISSYDGDVDCYRVALEKAAVVQLQFTFAQVAEKKEVYHLTLASDPDGLNVLWEGSVSGLMSNSASPQICLPGGAYFIRVENPLWNPNGYRLQLKTLESKAEAEPNDLISSATPVLPGQAMYGSLIQTGSALGDVDNYRLSMAQPGSARILFASDAPNVDEVYFNFALAEALDYNPIHVTTLKGSESSKTSPLIYLNKGDYILQVTRGKRTTANAYSLKVDEQDSPAGEQEYNDDPASAAAFPLNATLTGNSAQKQDDDYFAISISEPGALQLNLSFSPSDSSEKVYKVSLWPSGDMSAPIWNQEISADKGGAVSPPYCLPSGMYFALVKNELESDSGYYLANSFQPISGIEIEPNDASAKATPLNPGVPLTGSLAGKDDVDCYAINIPSDSQRTLDFKFNATTGDARLFVLELERSGKVVWSGDVSGNSGGIRLPMQISAGDYVIRVKPHLLSSALYTLSFD